MAVRRNLHALPLVISILIPLTFVTTFFLAVYFNHVYYVLPYISDLGTASPESCIFSQFLNVTAFLFLLCVYIRYLQIGEYATFRSPIGTELNLNSVAWHFGSAACLGMSIVANFQVNHQVQVHYVGAVLTFLGGTVYFGFQTYFSYQISKIENTALIFYFRVSLCFLASIFLLSTSIAGFVSAAIFVGANSADWTPNDPGYDVHIVSSFSEWLMALTLSLLVLTFLPEFKGLIIHMPKMEIDGIHRTDSAHPS